MIRRTGCIEGLRVPVTGRSFPASCQSCSARELRPDDPAAAAVWAELRADGYGVFKAARIDATSASPQGDADERAVL